jgi:putative glutamine amidotransferase
MADRPVIGLCAAVERARWGVWDTPAHLLPREYADAVQRAGGIALLLPPDPRAVEHPDELLDLLDGLILAGGSDIDPAAYGHTPHPATINTNPERDAFEIALATRAVARDLPFLGSCRGMQVLRLAPGSLAARAAGEEEHRTLSHHHQAVDAVGEGLVVTGHSQLDDLPEAVELPGTRFVLGVQWHPEVDETSRLVAALVEDARERRLSPTADLPA